MSAAFINELADNNYLQTYLFTASDIGDWAGEETLALTQLNRIMKTIERSLNPLAFAPASSYIKNWVWKDWCGDTRILDASETEIIDYVYNLLSGYFAKSDVAA